MTGIDWNKQKANVSSCFEIKIIKIALLTAVVRTRNETIMTIMT